VAICKHDDDFVRDAVRWVVELSDGDRVIQDDGRPGEVPASAWLRLRAYLQGGDVHIKRMWLQFRSHRVEVEPSDADGYYFTKRAFAVWGDDITLLSYVCGAVVDDTLTVRAWRTPELVQEGDPEIRPVDPNSSNLILRSR
jgi:hypothetical protein